MSAVLDPGRQAATRSRNRDPARQVFVPARPLFRDYRPARKTTTSDRHTPESPPTAGTTPRIGNASKPPNPLTAMIRSFPTLSGDYTTM